jgi:hypothetical protein
VPLLIVAFTLFVILAAIALTPLALVQRYRLGTARRRARGWSATVNVAGLAFSSALWTVDKNDSAKITHVTLLRKDFEQSHELANKGCNQK